MFDSGDQFTVAGVYQKPEWARKHPRLWKFIYLRLNRVARFPCRNQPLRAFRVGDSVSAKYIATF
jgi:hypothetical protein